jgi:DNA modification methylase
MASWRIIEGDCRDTLASLDAGSVQTCVTSPPYFGLRDYGHEGQIGLEPTPDEFVAALVGVFREVRRVLADDGTVWLNLGDSYAQLDGQGNLDEPREPGWNGAFRVSPNLSTVAENRGPRRRSLPLGCKRKDLIGIPWMVAFALRADGWYLRSDIIWAKPNPMPESVTDRPTKAHEYLFLLSKRERYFYDADAIAEEAIHGERFHGGYADPKGSIVNAERITARNGRSDSDNVTTLRNKRSVWTVSTQPYPGAHFATFPPKLIEPCILAGCPEGGTVLDPFAGAMTTGIVALRHNRSFIGCELNPEYVHLGRDRIIADSPLLNTHAEAVA